MGSRSKNHKCGLIDGQEGREVVVAGFMIPNSYGYLASSNIVEVYTLASGTWRSARDINFRHCCCQMAMAKFLDCMCLALRA